MDFLKKYILSDWKLKALSFVLAVMLWLAIYHAGESQMSISVHLTPNNLSRNVIIRNMNPEDILVTVGGPVSMLKNLRARDVRIPLDFGDLKDGRHTINLLQTDIVVPNGVRIESVKPNHFMVEIESAVEKRLKTVVKLHDKWSGAYRVKSWYPQYVTVQGSKESLENRDYIETVPADGDFTLEEEELDVALDTKDLLIRKLRPETVRVIVGKK